VAERRGHQAPRLGTALFRRFGAHVNLISSLRFGERPRPSRVRKYTPAQSIRESSAGGKMLRCAWAGLCGVRWKMVVFVGGVAAAGLDRHCASSVARPLLMHRIVRGILSRKRANVSACAERCVTRGRSKRVSLAPRLQLLPQRSICSIKNGSLCLSALKMERRFRSRNER
jgi:hypothetical protein